MRRARRSMVARFSRTKCRAGALDEGLDEARARIADAGAAGVRDEADLQALLEQRDDLGGALALVVGMHAQEARLRRPDAIEQRTRVARVFGADDVGGAEGGFGALADVLQVADGRGDDDELVVFHGAFYAVFAAEASSAGEAGAVAGFDVGGAGEFDVAVEEV